MPTVFEAKSKLETIKQLAPFASLLLMTMICGAAFSRGARKEIAERDNNQCVETGQTKNLEAAHYNHSKKEETYNNPENGRLLSRPEHYMDHYKRHNEPDLGLTRRQNRWALNSIWGRMTKKERRGLPKPPPYTGEYKMQQALQF